MSFTIQLNPNDVAKVKSMLWGLYDVVPKVLSRAINETVGNVKTNASSEIRAVITARKKDVDATFKTTKATVTDLSAVFQSTGKPLPLISYSTRETKAGVSVQVRKDKPFKLIPGVFIETVKSEKQKEIGSEGHKGVFWREWHGTKTGMAVRQFLRGGKPIVYAKLPKKYRLPIKERFGPRIPDYLGDTGPIMGNVLKKADDFMHKNINDQLNYELSKL